MLTALVLWLVFTWCFGLAQIHGQEMFPALKDGDLCVIYRRQLMDLMGEKVVRKDVIAYTVDGRRYFGRVAAKAGDIVVIDENGSVMVNGSPDSREILYPTYPRGELTYPYHVPEGYVYVLGDRRTDTVDSRDLGPVSLDSVEGKVLSILRRRGL